MGYHLTEPDCSDSTTPKTAYPRFIGSTSGLRFFAPQLGRWISRDPITEEGFSFLEHIGDRTADVQRGATHSSYTSEYVHNWNNALSIYDALGLTPLADDFWLAYPDYSHDAVETWRLFVGGTLGAKELAKRPIPNTCAARVSYALNSLPGNHVTTPYDDTNRETPRLPGLAGKYVINASNMSTYLSKHWGKNAKCSDTEAYFFVSGAQTIDSLRDEIMAVFKKCDSNCKTTYTAVVVYKVSPGLSYSGHVCVVRSDYSDKYTPLTGAISAEVWLLPPTTRRPVKNP